MRNEKIDKPPAKSKSSSLFKAQFQLRGFMDGTVAATVKRSDSGSINRGIMLGSAVALVVLPTIMGILLMELFHQAVAMRFGHDTCSGNRRIESIAFYNTFVFYLT